ncbi:copper resistance protein NlpE [Flavobacterium agricola]|uniref:Copper resistance protein NlpE n=1 Tax=Flavobacterium agricola TaxID=2870839 RepID=A0ABY6LY00_9FLAO|nr:copper resistance protein NlpE [Flavobacterium agricola]UYW01207.1 copper resistance protein NlpE [Flavobacterium agricola]
MKKVILFSFVASFALLSCKKNDANANAEEVVVEEVVAVPDGSNAETALDWAGTYTATLPCADCPGINATVVLNDDNTFEVTYDYIDNPTNKLVDKGTFTWFNNGNAIETTGDGERAKYKVIENGLVQLDQDGNEVVSDMKELYVYKKQK